MKNLLLPLAITCAILVGCTNQHSHENISEENSIEPVAYTIYTDKVELFVEFIPLIIGTESKFLAHITELGENFNALHEGDIKLTLELNGKSISTAVSEPQVPGIFHLGLIPEKAGIGKLTFDIKAKNYSDQIIIDNIKVYKDENEVLDEQPEEKNVVEISYLKEQAWNVEFANFLVKNHPFYDIIKTSGQILSAPGDEVMVIAQTAGIVQFTGNNSVIGSKVNSGTNLFNISSSGLKEGNIHAAYKQASSNYEKAKIDYKRASELIIDQIISTKDFEDAKLKFEIAQITFNTLANNFSDKGYSISSPISGFVKNVFVSEGQYVEEGTALATVSQNKKLLLQANVSQKYFNKLSSISSANFKSSNNEKIFNTEDLNGKVSFYGKSAKANSPFIPITFEFDNPGNLIPGSFVELYLKSSPIPDALVIPVSSLLEEQGYFFVYVQTGGESFEKREVSLGASDGVNVQLLKGVTEGERVVSTGAYQIKLASASGALPAHGHEH